MNPEMLRISTMADRNDRALPPSATGRQRVVTLLESFSNAAHPDEQSEDNQDPFRHQQGVTLGTIHSSKGLQWPVVFIADMADHIIPGKSADNNLARMEEEQRLMYVAVTRAEDQYYLYWATTTEDGGDAEPRPVHRRAHEIEETHQRGGERTMAGRRADGSADGKPGNGSNRRPNHDESARAHQ